VGSKVTFILIIDIAEEQTQKYFSSCLPQGITSRAIVVCSTLHYTTLILQSSLDMSIATIPALKNPKFCACFQRPNTMFFIYWIQYYLRKYAYNLFLL